MKKLKTLTNADFRFIQASNIYMLGKSLFNRTIKVGDINKPETIFLENVINEDLGEGTLQVNYFTEFQVEPLFIFSDEKTSVLIRHSHFIDFKTMKENEPKVFDNISKPVLFYQLMICTKITKEQTGQLEEKIKQAHREKFGQELQNISIICEEWDNQIDPEEIQDYLDVIYEEN